MGALAELSILALAPIAAMLLGSLVCFVAGQRDWGHYRDSLPLVGLNIALVIFATLVVCLIRWGGLDSSGGFGGRNSLWTFLAWFLVIDLLSWCGHSLVHRVPRLRPGHLGLHHAKRDPYGLDQFYLHPIDNLLLFTIPGVTAFVVVPIGLESGAYAFSLAVFGNVLAHGPFDWEHRAHHQNQPVSLGGGVWFDWVMGTTTDTLGHKLFHWGGLVASFAAFVWWPWALLVLGLYGLFRLAVYHITEITALRQWVWKGFYAVFDQILAWTGNAAIDTMNWGYAAEPGGQADHPRGLHLALYERVLAGEVADAELLEVGSGRGGGAFALFERGARVTGLDLSPRHVARCEARARALDDPRAPRFVEGNAEAMPFADERFDLLVNVESSHCYPDFEAFLAECRRVLVAGGRLCWCDFRSRADWEALLARFESDLGWALVEHEDLTQGVLWACDAAAPWYRERLRAVAWLPPVHETLHNFACLPNSRNYREFAAGNWAYTRVVLVKRPD